ncbi:hypothetical protein ACQ4PT_018976 [Festuca glaucescens]
MGYSMSRLLKATISLVLLALFFMPGAMAATVTRFDATWSQHLPLPRGTVRGPESVAFDGQGHGPYNSVSDGRVLKWNNDKLGWTTYTYGPDYDGEMCTASRLCPGTATESRCGSPLGPRFHQKTGDLYMADAYKGLMRVGPGGGEATVLVNEVDGVPLCFTNGVDVDQITGHVYFTDSSVNCPRSQHEMVTKTGDSSRLMRYDP